MIQLLQQQQSTAARGLHITPQKAAARAALKGLYRKEYADLKERMRRAEEDKDSQEALTFSALFYANIVRKEFANYILREHALPRVEADKKLCRHSVKMNLRTVKREMARWDSNMAYSLRNETNIDRFDFLCEVMNRQLFRLYEPFYFTTMQCLTQNGCLNPAVVAGLETATALFDYTEQQLLADVKHFTMESPIVARLTIMLDTHLLHCLDTLRSEVGHRLMPREEGCVDLNADPMIDTAAKNLFRHLNSADGINSLVDQTFTEGVAKDWELV